MKIYIPHKTGSTVNGGNTFLKNIKKGLSSRVHIVDSLADCDILFIASPMTVDKNEVFEAKKLGKGIVLRVDNMPRKSRNKRSSPVERIGEYAQMADVVVYQSEWAKNYCYPVCGDGVVIYNGVDKDIFFNDYREKEDIYLFAFHGKNEHKGFWSAHYIFQQEFRKNKNAWFYFIYDFGKDLEELQNADFDFWNGERYLHYPVITDPKEMAELMRRSKYFIYPSICDASPNVLREALACGCIPMGLPDREMSGCQEVLEDHLTLGVRGIDEMTDEYIGIFNMVLQTL